MEVAIDKNSQFLLPAPHLNLNRLLFQSSLVDGCGVYAASPISRGIVIEISLVLHVIFNKEEYTAHGRHTLLHTYTFV